MYPNNDFRNYVSNSSDHLEHHGILGMKWGVRRFQNPDGTLTELGKKRYINKTFNDINKRSLKAAGINSKMQKNNMKVLKNLKKSVFSEQKDKYYKEIEKYTNENKILEKARNELTKDMSPEMIKLGEDYIKTQESINKAQFVGGLPGSTVVGLKKQKELGTRENIDKVKSQIRERLDTNDEFTKKRNSTKTDEEKDRRESRYDSISNKVSNARKTGKYDIDFLEGGHDVDQRTGKLLEGKALDKAYEEYLRKKMLK